MEVKGYPFVPVAVSVVKMPPLPIGWDLGVDWEFEEEKNLLNRRNIKCN